MTTGKKQKAKSSAQQSWYRLWRTIVNIQRNRPDLNDEYDPRWSNIDVFLKDMGPKPPGTRLYRKDPKKPFGPKNCIWAGGYAVKTAEKVFHEVTAAKAYEMLKAGEPIATICEKFGVSRDSVYALKYGRSWRHVTGIENPKLPTMYDRPGRPRVESMPPKVKKYADLKDIF